MEKSKIENENNLAFADELIDPVRKKNMNDIKLKMFEAMRKVQNPEDQAKLWDIYNEFEVAEAQNRDAFYLNFMESNAKYLISLLHHEAQIDNEMNNLLNELGLAKY